MGTSKSSKTNMRYAVMVALLLVACDGQVVERPKAGFSTTASGTTAATDSAIELDHVFARDGDSVTVTVKFGPRKVDTVVVHDTVTIEEPSSELGALPFGLNSADDSLWGKYGLTGEYSGVAVKNWLPELRKAESLGYHRMFVMPRRSQVFNNMVPGDSGAWYSVAQSKKHIDSVVAAVHADSMRAYIKSGALAGYVILDDPNCVTCWGSPNGKPALVIKQAQAESVYDYARAKFPKELPIGIRVHPSWVKVKPSLSNSMDFAWLQYVESKGDQKTWYDSETAIAKALPHPLKIAYGVNVYNYSKTQPRIPAATLSQKGKLAINYSGNCFASFWRWWPDWRKDGRGPVFDTLAALAASKKAPSCKS